MGRELAGWGLAALGLALIGVVVYLAMNRAVIEAAAVALPATIVFRAGISLVKLAIAGRIAAHDSLPERLSYPPDSKSRNAGR